MRTVDVELTSTKGRKKTFIIQVVNDNEQLSIDNYFRDCGIKEYASGHQAEIHYLTYYP